MFNEKKLLRPYATSSQSPLDPKGFFADETDMLNVSSLRPLEWYKNLQAVNMSNNKKYTWKESVSGLINGGYTYPENVVSFGIIYSNKTFNFVENTSSAVSQFIWNELDSEQDGVLPYLTTNEDPDSLSVEQLIFSVTSVSGENLTALIGLLDTRKSNVLVKISSNDGSPDIAVYSIEGTNFYAETIEIDVLIYNGLGNIIFEQDKIYNIDFEVFKDSVGSSPTTQAQQIFLSNNFTPYPNSLAVLSGDDVETAIRKLVYQISLLQPPVASGNLTIISEDLGVRISGNISLNKDGLELFNGPSVNGVISFTAIAAGKYDIIFTNPEYDVSPLLTTVVDNDNSDNSVVQSTVFNVDVGEIDSVVTFELETSIVNPIINRFLINEGEATTSNPNLRLSLYITGPVTEISITRTLGAADNWVPYTAGVIPYYGVIPYEYAYISSIKATLFVKVRNPQGESEKVSDDIFLVNGIRRTDNSLSYNQLKEAIDDVVADYPNGLTRHVEILVVSEVINTISGDWIAELINFNQNSQFYLKINGNNLLTLDCDTVGGFRLDFTDNIVFHKIAFINVSSYQNHAVPEQMCALFANTCNNIVLDRCSIDGRYLDDLSITGRFAIVVKDCNNFTISNSTIEYFKATGIDVSNTNSFFFLKSTIKNCESVQGIISQPSLMQLSNIDYFKVQDSVIDALGMDTGISGINVTRTHINRCELKNSKGEILSFQNTRECLLLSIKNCLIIDNLLSPLYPWTKQQIEINYVETLEMINNTTEIKAISGTGFYSKVVRALSGIGTCRFYNNIVDYNMPGMANNLAESAILQTKTIAVLEWDYNLYRDNLDVNGDMINMILQITETNSPVYLPSPGRGIDQLANMQLLGADNNSTIIPTTETLLTSASYTDIVPQLLLDTPALPSEAPLYDFNKFTADTIANIGCQYLNGEVGVDVTDIEYFGTTITDGTEFEETDVEHILYSGSGSILEIDIYNDDGIYLWTFSTPGDIDIIKIGSGILAILYSELDVNDLYVEDNLYSLTIEKI
jgi:hypothetical protein